MISNVFTKTEILQNLASKGCYIDAYTLDSFLKKNKIEAVFEDAEGNELFDKNAMNSVMEGLYHSNNAPVENSTNNINDDTLDIGDDDKLDINDDDMDDIFSDESIKTDTPPKPSKVKNISKVEGIYGDVDPEIGIEDALDMINDISLSDGTMLVNKLEDFENTKIEGEENAAPNSLDAFEQSTQTQPQEQQNISSGDTSFNNTQNSSDNFSSNSDLSNFDSQFNTDDMSSSDDFDDMSLLSESFEAQEKLRQYVISEMSRNNLDINPQQQGKNNASSDISEKEINTIARAMAKKMAKYVGSIISKNMQQFSKASKLESENRRLMHKLKEYDDQNKKLKLLLAEANKNLNSFKPGPFGFYVKVNSGKTKK